MTLWQGVLLMVIRALESSVAKNIQRWAQRPEKPRPVVNILGVLLKVCTGPMDAIAYSLAPQLTLAPFGMTLGLVFDFVAARRLHGDAVTARDIFAGVLVVTGTAICLVNGAEDESGVRQPPSLDLLMRYTATVSMMTAMLLSAIVRLQDTRGSPDALAHAALGALLGSMTLVAGKVLIAHIVQPSRSLVGTLCYGMAAVVTVPLHLYILNRGFGRHSLVFLSPVSGALQLICNVTTGLMLYCEVPMAPHWFSCGIVLLIGGVAMFCLKTKASTRDVVFAGMMSPYARLLR